jgi:hypothetical protein
MPVQAIPTIPKRLRILGDEEIDALYGRPRFTPDEQQEYFAFSPPELAALAQFHSRPSRLYSMLQLGYFKARQQFFVFSLREVDEDIRYLQEHYFPTARWDAPRERWGNPSWTGRSRRFKPYWACRCQRLRLLKSRG